MLPLHDGELKRPRRAAVFVDFDNVYSGLRVLDPSAAERFATDPGHWTNAIAIGDGGAQARRFLVRNCYLNPFKFSKYRAYWARAGYRVIDCPSLTQQGKSSTDINLVLDAVDILSGPADVEEFFIASADADFTSLIQRFRAADRLTTVIVAGSAASAYRNMADGVVEADDLVSILNEQVRAVAAPTEAVEGPGVGLSQPPEPQTARISEGDVKSAEDQSKLSEAAAAVLSFIKAAPGPVSGAQAAMRARVVDPGITTDWEGYNSLKAWLAQLGDDVALSFKMPPGWLWDANRFTIDDIPNLTDDRPALQQQVSRVTDVPALSTTQYQQLFTALESRLNGDTSNRYEIAKQVRDDCADAGVSVARSAVYRVMQGLLYAGISLNAGTSAAQLASGWAKNVEDLCLGARMEFTEAERDELREWAGGGLASQSR